MLHKTKGIVLNHLKYGDNKLVTTIYTETHGRRAFLVHGVYKHKSKFHSTFFQPLTLLDLEVNINPKRELQQVKDINFDYSFQAIPYDNTKRAIALFLAEILYKSLKEEEPNTPLFNYLFHAIQLLDANETGMANFHLVFLMNLTKYLGFYPIDNYSETDSMFDPINGRFYTFLSTPSPNADRTLSFWIHKLLTVSFDQLESLHLNHQTRNDLIRLMIDFYHVHLGSLGVVKSLPILQSVFEEDE